MRKKPVYLLFLCILTSNVKAGSNFTGNENFTEFENGIGYEKLTNMDIISNIIPLENDLDIKNKKIDGNIDYPILLSGLEYYCEEKDIQQAKSRYEELNTLWRDSLLGKNKNRILKKRFDKLKEKIQEIKTGDISLYCNSKYLFYSLLESTQKLYRQHTVSLDFHSSKEDILKITIPFKQNVKAVDKEMRDKVRSTTESYVKRTLMDFYLLGILNKKDISLLGEKMKITHINTCENTKGNIQITKNKQTNEIQFKSLELNIPYCSEDYDEENVGSFIRNLLAHEVGHYVYYFKDNHPSDFSEICRSKGKLNCIKKDFVTEYAMEAEEEDYAESFAYWYLYETKEQTHNSGPIDTPIERRNRYFEYLAEEFRNREDEDNEDNENIK